MALHEAAYKLIASYVVMNVAAIVAVVMRFMSIRRTRRSLKPHDYLCVVSLIFNFGYSIVTLISTVDGKLGLHITEVTPDQLRIALVTFFASQFFWAIGIASFRISILLLYLEIFVVPIFAWLAWSAIGFVVAFFIGSITTSLTICQPVAFAWDKTITTGHCGDMATAEMAVAAINLVPDVVIVLLPLPILWKLKLSKSKKIGVTIAFALGLVISAINLARIVEVLNCSLLDFTYCTLDSAILTVAELAVGVIVACAPTWGALFRRPGADDTRNYASGGQSATKASSKWRLRSTVASFTETGTKRSVPDSGSETELRLGYQNYQNYETKSYVSSSGTPPTNSIPYPAGGGDQSSSHVIGVERQFVVSSRSNSPQDQQMGQAV